MHPDGGLAFYPSGLVNLGDMPLNGGAAGNYYRPGLNNRFADLSIKLVAVFVCESGQGALPMFVP